MTTNTGIITNVLIAIGPIDIQHQYNQFSVATYFTEANHDLHNRVRDPHELDRHQFGFLVQFGSPIAVAFIDASEDALLGERIRNPQINGITYFRIDDEQIPGDFLGTLPPII